MRRSTLVPILAIGLVTSSFVAVDTAFADSDTTAQTVNSNKTDRLGPKSKFGVDFGVSFAKPKSEVTQSNGGTTIANVDGSSSKNITSIGIDYRAPLYLVLGNIANITYAANLGNVGNFAIRRKGPVVGLWGRIFFGGDDQNETGFDLHPTPGTDTLSAYSKSFFLLPYIGYEFGVNLANSPADLTFFTGPRFERRKIKLSTDQGAGFQEFSNSDLDVGWTVGVDLDIPLVGLANLGGGSVPFLRIGGAYDWSPSIGVSGTTIGPAFDYSARIRSGGTWRFFLGAGVAWGASR